MSKVYTPTIGIECHVQLKTLTKLFAGVNNDAREVPPNTLISPLCLGLPGTLPVLNEKAVTLAIRAGIALNAEVARYSKFDRKHYFYPDLPKGYQITQFEEPIILNGRVDAVLANGEIVSVRIESAHLEEDAGKSTHPEGSDYSLVDLNRAGTPLIEIITAPDMHSPAEVKACARELYLLMKYADVSFADLYYGNIRFDVNVSVSNDPSKLGTRTETKNLNSFRAVEKAVEYEIKRQTDLLEKGELIVQETRGWNDAKQKTFSQRSKEDAHDYRYFPEPDIPPIVLTDSDIDTVRAEMPHMPSQLRETFLGLGLDRSQVESLLDEPDLAKFLDYIALSHDKGTAKTIGNWLTGELARLLTQNKLTTEQITDSGENLVTLAAIVDGKEVGTTTAKEMLEPILLKNVDPREYAKQNNLLQVSDEGELVIIVQRVIVENQKAADDVRNGELKAIGFLVGQVMRHTRGNAHPGMVQELLKKQLGAK